MRIQSVLFMRCKLVFVQHGAEVDLTRMWDNTQRDGRPAQYRWRPLCNASNFGLRSLLECRAVTLPRRETR